MLRLSHTITNRSKLLKSALEALLEVLVVLLPLLLHSKTQVRSALLGALARSRVAFAHFALKSLVAEVFQVESSAHVELASVSLACRLRRLYLERKVELLLR